MFKPEMASERMRILIRKFELNSTAISSQCLAVLGSPETLPDCSQSHFGKYCGFLFSFILEEKPALTRAKDSRWPRVHVGHAAFEPAALGAAAAAPSGTA